MDWLQLTAPSDSDGNESLPKRKFVTRSGTVDTGELTEERTYFASRQVAERAETERQRVSGAIVTRTAQILKFVSRADHLKWREHGSAGDGSAHLLVGLSGLGRETVDGYIPDISITCASSTRTPN